MIILGILLSLRGADRRVRSIIRAKPHSGIAEQNVGTTCGIMPFRDAGGPARELGPPYKATSGSASASATGL
jgi:hypothetical protein